MNLEIIDHPISKRIQNIKIKEKEKAICLNFKKLKFISSGIILNLNILKLSNLWICI